MLLLEYLRLLVLLGALAPLAYYLLAIYAARRFFAEPPAKKDFAPPVSVLVPVHYPEGEVYENFASLCAQDYPDYEILFAAAESDPATGVIERLKAEHPARTIRLVSEFEPLGANGKVSKLARLAREARQRILVVCDDDVRVPADFLRGIVAPLADATVGAVSCFYLSRPDNFWAELEALGSTTEFFAGALVARELEGVRFALGAAMAVPRERLAEIGGFAALADSYADDYELGRRIAAGGWRVELARAAVTTQFPAHDWRSFFEHQLRWALVVRHARPAGYLGLLFTHGLPWALAASLVSQSASLAVFFLGGYLALRLGVTWTVGVEGLGDALVRRKWWLVPLRDALAFVVWLAGFFRKRISWRGAQFRIRRGRLVPLG